MKECNFICQHQGNYGVGEAIEGDFSQFLEELEKTGDLKDFAKHVVVTKSVSYYRLSKSDQEIADHMLDDHKLECQKCLLRKCPEDCGWGKDEQK